MGPNRSAQTLEYWIGSIKTLEVSVPDPGIQPTGFAHGTEFEVRAPGRDRDGPASPSRSGFLTILPNRRMRAHSRGRN
jgi:hypothetical protein